MLQIHQQRQNIGTQQLTKSTMADQSVNSLKFNDSLFIANLASCIVEEILLQTR